MSFAGRAAKLCLILRIDLPTHNIRLSEGGEVDFEGSRYSSSDDIFGIITEFQSVTSGEADEAPAFEVTWAPKDIAAAVALSNPSIQGSFVDWQMLSIDRDTNAVLTSHVMFRGIVDYTEISADKNVFDLRMGFATEIDRLLNTDKGNRLSRAFHQSVWSGEQGLDFMTGTSTPIAWGDKDQNIRGGGGNLRINSTTDFR